MVDFLDVKDKKILYELDVNSRISYAQIARKTKLKQETIRYRIQNLVKKNIIFKFQTIIDSSKLKLTYYKIFLRLRANEDTRKNIIEYLSNNNKVTWVGKIDGLYDVGINVLTENHNVLNQFLSSLFNNYPDKIIEKKISMNLEGYFFNRDYLINKNRVRLHKKEYTSQKNKCGLNKIDFNILSLLCENSRITTVEIGNKLNISHDSALQKLKKLEKQKIISGHTIVLNNEIIKQLNYKVLIYLSKFSNESILNMINYLSMFKEVTYVVKSLGAWDMDFEMEVKNVQKAREIMISLTDKFSDCIEKYDLLLIYDFTKYDFLPKNYKFEEYESEISS